MFLSRKQLVRLFHGTEGLATTEYATMLALIIIVCISALKALNFNCSRIFIEAARALH